MKILKKSVALISVLVLGYIGFELFSFGVIENSSSTDLTEQFKQYYRVFALKTPKVLEFSDESIPLHILDVQEKLDRELLVNTYWQSNGILLHKKANRFFPIIEPILVKNGIPTDFKYLALIESGLENVVSPAGATGFWQIMEATGKEYGLEINYMVDERYNLEKSTEVACEYLKDAKKKLGTWTLAAGAYNMGMNGIRKQLKRQKANNYYDLLLNSETGRYVYRILAVKEILEHSENYGFYYNHSDLYSPYQTVTLAIDSTINDLAGFALDQGINYKILKLLNPWLRDDKLVVKAGKVYTIQLPSEKETRLHPVDTLPFSEPNDTITQPE